MGVACLPKQSDYANDDNFEKIGRFIGGGIGGNGESSRIHIYQASITSIHSLLFSGQETGDRLKILTYNLTVRAYGAST